MNYPPTLLFALLVGIIINCGLMLFHLLGVRFTVFIYTMAMLLTLLSALILYFYLRETEG